MAARKDTPAAPGPGRGMHHGRVGTHGRIPAGRREQRNIPVNISLTLETVEILDDMAAADALRNNRSLLVRELIDEAMVARGWKHADGTRTVAAPACPTPSRRADVTGP